MFVVFFLRDAFFLRDIWMKNKEDVFFEQRAYFGVRDLQKNTSDEVVRQISRRKKANAGTKTCLHFPFALVEIVSLLEFVDASTGVNKFLFAREVGMAL